MSDVGTVLWKEAREVYLRKGRPSQATWSAGALVLLGGIVVPIAMTGVVRAGAGLPDGGAIVAAAVTGAGVVAALFVGLTLPAAIVLDQFVGERERHTMETLLAGPLPDRAILWGKVLLPVIAATAVATAMGIVQGVVFTMLLGSPGLIVLLLAPVNGLLAAAIALPATACGAAIGTRAKSLKSAQQTFGLAMVPFILLLQASIAFGVSPLARLGADAGPAAAAVMGVGLALLYGLLTGCSILWADRRFRRPRLLGRPD